MRIELYFWHHETPGDVEPDQVCPKRKKKERFNGLSVVQRSAYLQRNRDLRRFNFSDVNH